SLRADLQYRKKGFLRNIHLPNAFHSPLSFFLFLQQLAFAGNITAITLGQNIFSDGGNRFPRNHAMADGRLDGDLKHLARDKFLHLIRKSLAARVRGITMNHPGNLGGLTISSTSPLVRVSRYRTPGAVVIKESSNSRSRRS